MLSGYNSNVAYSGSKKSPPLLSLLRVWVGQEGLPDAFMTKRERFDFGIVTLIFGVLVAACVQIYLFHYQTFIGNVSGQIRLPF